MSDYRPRMFAGESPPPEWPLPRVRANPLTNQLMPGFEFEDNENTRVRKRAASVSHLIRLGLLEIGSDDAGESDQAVPAAADDQDWVGVSNQDTGTWTHVSSPSGLGQADDQGTNDMQHYATADSAPSTPLNAAVQQSSSSTVIRTNFSLRPSPDIQRRSGDRRDVFIPDAISMGNGLWLDSNFRQEAAGQSTNTRYPNTPYPNAPYPNTPYPGTPYPGTPYPNTPYFDARYAGSFDSTEIDAAVAYYKNVYAALSQDSAVGAYHESGFAGPSQNEHRGGGPATVQGRPSYAARLNNTCLWIARLPADCTLKDLFAALAGCGKIYSANISERGDTFYEYAAANLTFWALEDLNKFIAKVRRGEFVVKGLRPTVSKNRFVGASRGPSHESRVVVVGGPSAIINRGFLDLNVFIFFHEVEDVIYQVQFEWWNSLEYRFASVSQAEEAVKALNRFKRQNQGYSFAHADWNKVKIRYGDDPCEKVPYA